MIELARSFSVCPVAVSLALGSCRLTNTENRSNLHSVVQLKSTGVELVY